MHLFIRSFVKIIIKSHDHFYTQNCRYIYIAQAQAQSHSRDYIAFPTISTPISIFRCVGAHYGLLFHRLLVIAQKYQLVRSYLNGFLCEYVRATFASSSAPSASAVVLCVIYLTLTHIQCQNKVPVYLYMLAYKRANTRAQFLYGKINQKCLYTQIEKNNNILKIPHRQKYTV